MYRIFCCIFGPRPPPPPRRSVGDAQSGRTRAISFAYLFCLGKVRESGRPRPPTASCRRRKGRSERRERRNVRDKPREKAVARPARPSGPRTQDPVIVPTARAFMLARGSGGRENRPWPDQAPARSCAFPCPGEKGRSGMEGGGRAGRHLISVPLACACEAQRNRNQRARGGHERRTNRCRRPCPGQAPRHNSDEEPTCLPCSSHAWQGHSCMCRALSALDCCSLRTARRTPQGCASSKI